MNSSLATLRKKEANVAQYAHLADAECMLITATSFTRSVGKLTKAFTVQKAVSDRLLNLDDRQRELKKILEELEMPIVRISDRVSDLHDNLQSR